MVAFGVASGTAHIKPLAAWNISRSVEAMAAFSTRLSHGGRLHYESQCHPSAALPLARIGRFDGNECLATLLDLNGSRAPAASFAHHQPSCPFGGVIWDKLV